MVSPSGSQLATMAANEPLRPAIGGSTTRMTFFILVALVVLAATGCASGGGSPEATLGPLDWPEGHFSLIGIVRFYHPSGPSQSETYEADLVVGPGGHMRLESTAGTCREPDPMEVQEQLARGVRTITCGNASYVLRPAGSTLRGEITVPYVQNVQERGRCLRRGEHGICLEYNVIFQERQATARVPLRVQRRG